MSSIIQFPHTLRADVDTGGHHVSIEIIGKGLNQEVHKVHLYVPQGFSLADSGSYGSIDLGTINAVERLVTKEGSGKGTEEAQDLEATAIGASILKSITGDSSGAVGASMQKAGVATNNQTTAVFEGMGIRNYQMAFNLVASSADESKTISILEHTFRKYMYPRVLPDGFALEYPPIFRIKFMTGKKQNKSMPLLFDSYLTGLTTSYNNNANMFHKDGSPTDVTIGLEFQEQRQLSREDLYDLEDVAPNEIVQRINYPKDKGSATTGGN